MSASEIIVILTGIATVAGAILGAAKMIASAPSERRKGEADTAKTYAEAVTEYAEEARKLRSELAEIRDENDKLRDRIDGLETSVRALTESIRTREITIEELKKQIRLLTDANVEKDREILELQNTIKAQQATIDRLTAELRAVKKGTGELKPGITG